MAFLPTKARELGQVRSNESATSSQDALRTVLGNSVPKLLPEI